MFLRKRLFFTFLILYEILTFVNSQDYLKELKPKDINFENNDELPPVEIPKPIQSQRQARSGNTEFNDFLQNGSRRQISQRPTLMDIALEASVREGLMAMQRLYSVVEPDMVKNGHVLQDNHPAALLSKFSAPVVESQRREMAAYATLTAAKAFRKNYDFSNDLARQAHTQKISLRRTALESLCPPRDPPTCMPASERYRTHDGTCNNKRRLRWGAAQMPFNRFLPPEYGDGVDSTRSSVEGGPLSSSRFVSLLVHGARDGEAPLTLMLAQWGQLLDHDLTSTAQPRSINGSVPSCCGNKDFHPSCFPIKVPLDDPWLSPLKVRCLEFLRSAPAQRRDCVLSWREQTNQATSYIDASPIYSSSVKSSDNARTFRNGLLVFGRGNPADDLCQRGAIATHCIRAGDGRSGEQPGLLALHHVWVHEHNHIAMKLSEMNLHWSDEKIYQETRRIIGAMFQHITYREFLPIVLGREVVKLFDLELLNSGYFEAYDPKTNPTVANAFAAAAFRFGHSLVQNSYMRCDRFHNVLQNNVSLHEEFQRGDIGSVGSLHRLIRGMASQRALKRDEFITPELTNHLFQTAGFPFGLDLAAINIQRGRDHGIPPYTQWRVPCGLTPINTWKEFANVVGPQSARRISHAYHSVHDIDLFVGGIAERPVVGGLVGPTFACVIAQQFSNSRIGDRFWYENAGFESSFTPAQLHAIRRVSLASVLCRAVGGGTFQPHIFLPAEFENNERLPCGVGSLSDFDISPWLEQDPFAAPTARPQQVQQLPTPPTFEQKPVLNHIFDIMEMETKSPIVSDTPINDNKVGFSNRKPAVTIHKDTSSLQQNPTTNNQLQFVPNPSTGSQIVKNELQINDKLDLKKKGSQAHITKQKPVPGVNSKLDKNNRKGGGHRHELIQTSTRRTIVINNIPIELRNAGKDKNKTRKKNTHTKNNLESRIGDTEITTRPTTDKQNNENETTENIMNIETSDHNDNLKSINIEDTTLLQSTEINLESNITNDNNSKSDGEKDDIEINEQSNDSKLVFSKLETKSTADNTASKEGRIHDTELTEHPQITETNSTADNTASIEGRIHDTKLTEHPQITETNSTADNTDSIEGRIHDTELTEHPQITESIDLTSSKNTTERTDDKTLKLEGKPNEIKINKPIEQSNNSKPTEIHLELDTEGTHDNTLSTETKTDDIDRTKNTEPSKLTSTRTTADRTDEKISNLNGKLEDIKLTKHTRNTEPSELDSAIRTDDNTNSLEGITDTDPTKHTKNTKPSELTSTIRIIDEKTNDGTNDLDGKTDDIKLTNLTSTIQATTLNSTRITDDNTFDLETVTDKSSNLDKITDDIQLTKRTKNTEESVTTESENMSKTTDDKTFDLVEKTDDINLKQHKKTTKQTEETGILADEPKDNTSNLDQKIPKPTEDHVKSKTVTSKDLQKQTDDLNEVLTLAKLDLISSETDVKEETINEHSQLNDTKNDLTSQEKETLKQIYMITKTFTSSDGKTDMTSTPTESTLKTNDSDIDPMRHTTPLDHKRVQRKLTYPAVIEQNKDTTKVLTPTSLDHKRVHRKQTAPEAKEELQRTPKVSTSFYHKRVQRALTRTETTEQLKDKPKISTLTNLDPKGIQREQTTSATAELNDKPNFSSITSLHHKQTKRTPTVPLSTDKLKDEPNPSKLTSLDHKQSQQTLTALEATEQSTDKPNFSTLASLDQKPVQHTLTASVATELKDKPNLSILTSLNRKRVQRALTAEELTDKPNLSSITYLDHKRMQWSLTVPEAAELKDKPNFSILTSLDHKQVQRTPTASLPTEQLKDKPNLLTLTSLDHKQLQRTPTAPVTGEQLSDKPNFSTLTSLKHKQLQRLPTVLEETEQLKDSPNFSILTSLEQVQRILTAPVTAEELKDKPNFSTLTSPSGTEQQKDHPNFSTPTSSDHIPLLRKFSTSPNTEQLKDKPKFSALTSSDQKLVQRKLTPPSTTEQLKDKPKFSALKNIAKTNYTASLTNRTLTTKSPRPIRTTLRNVELRQYHNRPSYTKPPPQKVIVDTINGDNQYEIEINIRQTNKSPSPLHSTPYDLGYTNGHKTNQYDRYTANYQSYTTSTPIYGYYPQTPTKISSSGQNHWTKPPTIIFLNEHEQDRTTTRLPGFLQSIVGWNSGTKRPLPASIGAYDRPGYEGVISSPHSQAVAAPDYQNLRPPAQVSAPGSISSFSQTQLGGGIVQASSSAVSNGNFGSIAGFASANGADSTFSFNIRKKPEKTQNNIRPESMAGGGIVAGGGGSYGLAAVPSPQRNPWYTQKPEYVNLPVNTGDRDPPAYDLPYRENAASPFSTSNSQTYYIRPKVGPQRKESLTLAKSQEFTDYDYTGRILQPLLNVTSIEDKDDKDETELEDKDDKDETELDYEYDEDFASSSLVRKFNQDGYLRPEHMIKTVLKTVDDKTEIPSMNSTVTDANNPTLDDNYVIPVLNSSKELPIDLPEPLTNRFSTIFPDSLGKHLNNEIFAEDLEDNEDEDILTQDETKVLQDFKHKRIRNKNNNHKPEMIAFAPINVLTKPERPDNWVIYDSPMEEPLLPQIPVQNMDNIPSSEFPKPIKENIWLDVTNLKRKFALQFLSSTAKPSDDQTSTKQDTETIDLEQNHQKKTKPLITDFKTEALEDFTDIKDLEKENITEINVSATDLSTETITGAITETNVTSSDLHTETITDAITEDNVTSSELNTETITEVMTDTSLDET